MFRFACVFGLCLALVGCSKQGEGDRCQVDADCDVNLTCSINTMTCILSASSSPDAAPAIDAPIPDARPADAPVPDAPQPDAS
ncbi:MAG TPA: hypothetical protein VKE22_14100 [Haliangiales bacterium]|nr:hypothetical protein [Haliangiales bacterium]